MEITGRIRDAAGAPLPGAAITAVGAAYEWIATATAGNDGCFSLSGEGIVALEIAGPDWAGPGSAVRHLPRVWRVEGSPRPQQAEVDLKLRPAQPVAVRGFYQGALLGEPTVETRALLSHCWFQDLVGHPVLGDAHWRAGDGNPWLFLAPGTVTQLVTMWAVPGFGTVMCHADNQGQGLRAGDQPIGLTVAADGVQELWLNEDVARSAVARLQKEWSLASQNGYTLSAEVQAYREQALAEIAAMRGIALPAPTDAGYLEARRERALRADAAAAAAMWALEKLVIERAEQDIARHRQIEQRVTLRLPASCDRQKLTVQYRQLQNAFHFGIFNNPRSHPISREPMDGVLWTAIKQAGLNFVPMSFLWSLHEPERGVRRDAEQDAIYPHRLLRENGFRMKGHVSVWAWHGVYPDQWTVFIPAWLYGLTPTEFQEAAYEHQKALTAFNCDAVDGFQAINEPMLSHTNAMNLNREQTIELVRRSSQGIRDGGSRGPIEVNCCSVFGEGTHLDVVEQGYERYYVEFIQDLIEAGVDFDAVGVQLYYGGYMYGDLFEGGFPICQLIDLSDLIDRYAALGKVVHVSEVSVPSTPPPPEVTPIGEWHGPWSPERQAAWIKAFYTLCYSKRSVEEISWWNPTDEGAFIYTGGLMTADYTPKPAYYALQDLIRGWQANGETTVAPDGSITWVGPAGTYELTVKSDGRELGKYTVEMRAGESATIELQG